MKNNNYSHLVPHLILPKGVKQQSDMRILLNNQMRLLGKIRDMKNEIKKLKREIGEQIEEKVVKNLDGKVHMINSALTHSMVLRKILEEKGSITREDINKKYEELGIK